MFASQCCELGCSGCFWEDLSAPTSSQGSDNNQGKIPGKRRSCSRVCLAVSGLCTPALRTGALRSGQEPEEWKQYLQRCSPRGCTGSSAGRNGSAPAPAPASLPSEGTPSRTSCTEKGVLRDVLLLLTWLRWDMGRGHSSSPQPHGTVQGSVLPAGI